MMIVRNRVNMRAVYFILSLLLISCSKDDASEVPGKFELQLGDNAENILLRADLTVE